MTASRPTLAVLADELGVSRTTVSNAFSRPDQLSPALRDRILEAAARHGYTGPDPVARGLARGRVGVVGLLLAASAGYAVADPAVRKILDGLVRTLAAEATGLLLVPEAVDAGLQPATTVPVDGFVVLSGIRSDPAVAAAVGRGLPMVAIDQPTGLGGPVVRIDERGGAAVAARHVRELGHRNVGIITLPLTRGATGGPIDAARVGAANNVVSAGRLEGFRRGLGDVDPILAWEVPVNHRDSGRQAVAAILDTEPDVTAVLVSSDAMALGAVEELRQRGLRVPDDVSVTGFDDIDDAATAPVPLTTVRQPLFERGVDAGQLILDLIAGEHPGRPKMRKLELVVRESTGPAPSEA